ncbi:MAG: aminopeptidase [Bacteroidota bacterium]
MHKFYFILFLFFGYHFNLVAQTNEISIKAKLDPKYQTIDIEQEITYHNNSSDILDTIYIHNWANAYDNRKTPLSKRLIENYDKGLYFAKIQKRGYSKITDISIDHQITNWNEDPEAIDIVKVILPNSLLPKQKVTLSIHYTVKVPIDNFTHYGFKENNYNLRYWYITPAVYDGKWHTMSNLDMDDLYIDPTNYSITFVVPRGFSLHSDLNSEIQIKDSQVIYNLEGKNRTDIELSIKLLSSFDSYLTDSLEVVSNLKSKNLTIPLKTDILNRQLYFITEFLGKYPHKKILVNDITYRKNQVYGLNQLPKSLTPFSDAFEWDIKMFKALTKKYIENTILVNKRDDYWLADGIQIYMMMEYISKYYPEIKATGNISKIWGFRSYSLAKLDFNGKYPFVYQFAARKNIDQSLITRADSLSNFNRKIVNKYKAGIGLRYLDAILNDSIVIKSLQQYYNENILQLSNSDDFKEIITKKTDKNLDPFFIDYIQTKKKIDYTINSVDKKGDSLMVTIENVSDMAAPVALYGVKDKEILYKQWIAKIDSSKTVTIPRNGFDRISLNYEYLYPEINLRNNWKKIDQKILNRPLKFTFFKDIEDPYYNQIFYNIYTEYNYYDGLILGPQLYNQALFKKKWLLGITPAYAFKSNSIVGSFNFSYQYLPENSIVYRYSAGISGSKSHYDKNLFYKKLNPYFLIQFNRKSLRDVGGSSLLVRYNVVDKEIPQGVIENEFDSYNILDIRYGYSQPNIINDLRYSVDFQYNVNFSKIALDFRYRKLTDKHRQFDFRLFLGTFLFNKTTTDFFSFALDRPSDYLFEYSYLGRSEDSGFFSQEIIISDGGFKTIFEKKYANQWIASTNFSVSVWRWIELYTDAGFVKNKNENAFFRYDSGVRLNFIHNFLELYFPMQSSLGFEPSQPEYFSKIRFVLTANPSRIYNFIRRGFY